MTIHVEIGSQLRTYAPNYNADVSLKVECEPSTTVGQLIEKLGIPLREAGIIMVNRRTVGTDEILKDEDQVGLFVGAFGG